MDFISLLFKKKEVTYVAIRYNATGVYGYSFRNREKEVFKISCVVSPNPDVYMCGFNKELVHKNLDEQMTLIPGIRRTIVDQYGKIQCYFEFVKMNEYHIITKRVAASVKVLENGWEIYQGETRVANILRIPKMKRTRFEENGYDMEEYFLITISKKTDFELYPYIMSVPMLGF